MYSDMANSDIEKKQNIPLFHVTRKGNILGRWERKRYKLEIPTQQELENDSIEKNIKLFNIPNIGSEINKGSIKAVTNIENRPGEKQYRVNVHLSKNNRTKKKRLSFYSLKNKKRFTNLFRRKTDRYFTFEAYKKNNNDNWESRKKRYIIDNEEQTMHESTIFYSNKATYFGNEKIYYIRGYNKTIPDEFFKKNIIHFIVQLELDQKKTKKKTTCYLYIPFNYHLMMISMKI